MGFFDFIRDRSVGKGVETRCVRYFHTGLITTLWGTTYYDGKYRIIVRYSTIGDLLNVLILLVKNRIIEGFKYPIPKEGIDTPFDLK